jgi:RNA recognition motif-containing protein
MEIYVGNWPSGADNYDLRKLFERDLLRVGIHRRMRGLFRRRDNQERERFRVVIEQKNGVTFHYGRVTLEPDDMARIAIERLNGSNYRGNVLVVREWQTRAYQNDRRALNWRTKPWNKLERRRIERRESSVMPEDHPDF